MHNMEQTQNSQKSKKVAIIVAHPDDETLWAGGTILLHPEWDCFIVSLCRANDENRATKFYKVLKSLEAKGIMGNLNDGPKQLPMLGKKVEQLVLNLLPVKHFDLIITHHPQGEYTKHLRHEEVSKAVINLWYEGKITTESLWVFAYEDGQKTYLPRSVEDASFFNVLPTDIWQQKYDLMTQTYGFKPESWEAQTTPKSEAFWIFEEANEAKKWLDKLSK